MYGRDTFIRFASSVCDTPSSFIRSRMRRRNAEPILSIAFIPFNQPSRHPQFTSPAPAPCAQPPPAASSPCIPKYPHWLQCIVYAYGTSSQKGILSSIGSNIATIFNLAHNDLRMTSFVLDGTLPNHCLKSLTTSVLILALV